MISTEKKVRLESDDEDSAEATPKEWQKFFFLLDVEQVGQFRQAIFFFFFFFFYPRQYRDCNTTTLATVGNRIISLRRKYPDCGFDFLRTHQHQLPIYETT